MYTSCNVLPVNNVVQVPFPLQQGLLCWASPPPNEITLNCHHRHHHHHYHRHHHRHHHHLQWHHHGKKGGLADINFFIRKPPLLLVYDGVHYETLLPATHEDSLLTMELVNNWRQGDFNISHRDIDDARGAAESNKEREETKATKATKS